MSRTAVGVTWLRAQENERADALFRDPYAEAFLTEAREVVARQTIAAGRGDTVAAIFGLHVVLRTRFYDDYLLAATRAEHCRQVVLLAAGLDARAFRLSWPDGVRLFELDLPEGLFIYLIAGEAAGLLTAVDGLSAPGSRLSCEHRDNARNSILDKARSTPTMDEVTVLWKGGLGEDISGWLDRAGWRVATHNGTALAEGYGRPDPDAASVGFLTAVKEGSRAGIS